MQQMALANLYVFLDRRPSSVGVYRAVPCVYVYVSSIVSIHYCYPWP